LFEFGPKKLADNCSANVAVRVAMHVAMAALCLFVVFWLNAALSSSPSLGNTIQSWQAKSAPATGLACRTWLFNVGLQSKRVDRVNLMKARPSGPCGWSR
jgi:hypothetical protein